MEKICGIYSIKNTFNNNIYIGQSINIYKRWQEHKRQLLKNEHKNKILQKDYDNFGLDYFEFNIVEITEKCNLNDREVHWINKFNSFKNGYNMTEGGDINPMTYEPIRESVINKIKGNKNWLGKHHTKETKEKMSKSAIGRKMSKESKIKLSNTRKSLNLGGSKGVEIFQIDINTNEIVGSFKSISQAEIYFSGKITGNISRSMRNKNGTAYGYRLEK